MMKFSTEGELVRVWAGCNKDHPGGPGEQEWHVAACGQAVVHCSLCTVIGYSADGAGDGRVCGLTA